MIDIEVQQSLRSKFNPDGSLLRRHQVRMLDMLKYIDKICKKHNIQYWLSSGTLLGAVRHGGFIPWDDDVDIEMLRDDYIKLVKILQQKSHSDYTLQTHDTDPEYLAPYAKLRDLHSYIKESNSNDLYYKYKGCYIDIFVLEPSCSYKLHKIADVIHWYLLSVIPLKIKSQFIRKLYIYIIYRLVNKIIFPVLRILSKIHAGSNLRVVLGSYFTGIRNRNDLFPLKRIQFEDSLIPVPNNYDSYLKKIYGNYMQIPDLNKLSKHVVDVDFFNG